MSAQAKYAADCEELRERRRIAYAKVRNVVNEGAWARFILKGSVGPKSVGSGMPDHMYEHQDHGLHAPKDIMPTPKQIDYAYLVDAWFGDYREPGRPKNGLQPYQWKILELRGYHEMTNAKGGWRLIEKQFNTASVYFGYGRSYQFFRLSELHGDLLDIAFDKAIARGYVSA